MGKKILMICYYYPPLTDVGCKRSVAFAKYWHKEGWHPHVLSVKNPDKYYCSLGDDKPPEDIPVTYAYSLLNVYRFFGRVNGILDRLVGLFGGKLKHNYFYDIFCVPDIFFGWIIPAIISGYRIITRERIDIIYVSVSPVSGGIIGWVLKILTGKTLVVDFRDLFGVDGAKYNIIYGGPLIRKLIDRLIVASILKLSDLFIVTTGETKELYLEQFPEVREKIRTIYNGFDDQFLSVVKEQEKNSKFTIIYTGNFYYNIAFDYFFEALGILKNEGMINSEEFQFLFYGGQIERIQDSIERWDVGDLIHVKPRIPYVDILVEIKRAHIQLLRIIQPMISTKLFEGIALDIPLLSTIPEGEVARIVRKYSPSSAVITDESASSVASWLGKAVISNRKDFPGNNIQDFLASFSRRELSLELLKFL
ncbi:hypothetical protein DSCA_12110 [Desulfosarcina alkanivorans]|uniref:Glycosyltransferase subfamily 4-like N-terminal domain-containing protein n=1 Tax=Desulfosarcina alkanivorans TaxID=571177 RepID=A0A5K7YKF0_9BACT|nr:glycosyltransferase [Desulfosarcina alkanivorans]BBO67281.1 hypothetical protein DSCA_12110 [Desulfosarcina alkanivorans]